ncbi:MAG: hypothetical protein JWN30_1767 [Bacilli bacterium]|nr:hypothetical protein [Bacilli bacterium]
MNKNPTGKNMYETQPNNSIAKVDREPFNDVLSHFDSISGHQRPKRLDQYPMRFRKWARLYAIILVVMILGSLVWSVIHSFL